MRLRIIFLFMALAALAAMTPGSRENEQYLNTFETVWKKVNDTYFDPAFGGVDWKGVHDRYGPRIAAAEKDEDFYRLVNAMLWELKVSHANLVPPGSIAFYEPLVFAEGSPGINVRLLDGKAVVTSVKPGSPAHEAGLSPGYVIQAVDGISIEQIVQEAESRPSPPFNSRGQVAKTTKALLGRIYGASGTEVLIAWSDKDGTKREQKISREKRSGRAVGPGGLFFFAIEFEARGLDNGIGYIRLNTLQPQLAAQVSRAIESMGDLRGIILDLRGNSGGEIERMPELFLEERTWLYMRKTRDAETKAFFDAADDAYKGPLVLLIDALSGSASELLAAGLQAAGRAVVVGERSPGSVMESDTMIFPNGAVFMYPVARLATPDGTVLEGHGVVPDVEAGLDREMLLKGVDSQLDAAVRELVTASIR
jgi:carboxyl-terminal processing protease